MGFLCILPITTRTKQTVDQLICIMQLSWLKRDPCSTATKTGMYIRKTKLRSQGFCTFFWSTSAMYFATSAQQTSLSAFSSGISIENSSSRAIMSSTLSKLSRFKSFWKSAVSVTYKMGRSSRTVWVIQQYFEVCTHE